MGFCPRFCCSVLNLWVFLPSRIVLDTLFWNSRIFLWPLLHYYYANLKWYHTLINRQNFVSGITILKTGNVIFRNPNYPVGPKNPPSFVCRFPLMILWIFRYIIIFCYESYRVAFCTTCLTIYVECRIDAFNFCFFPEETDRKPLVPVCFFAGDEASSLYRLIIGGLVTRTCDVGRGIKLTNFENTQIFLQQKLLLLN